MIPISDACIGRVTFVGSLESDGPVCEDDLLEDKFRALRNRIKRANQVPRTIEGVRDVLLEEHARAVAALDNVIYDVVDVVDVGGRFPDVRFDVIRRGVRLALAKLVRKARRCKRRSSGYSVGLNCGSVRAQFRARPPIGDIQI